MKRAQGPGPSFRGAKQPHVVVCAGGGGVGKTTTSAALALALAHRGHLTLIVTIDPARRLAGALGVPISHDITQVALPSAQGRLFALMPDPRHSLRTLVEQLFEHEPEAKARVFSNVIYQGFADAAPGVHELVAMNLVAQAALRGGFDRVVVDTAPSRHAIDFVTYPGRLASLFGGRAITWLSALAHHGRGPATGDSPETPTKIPRKTGAIQKLVGFVTGPVLMRETAALFSELARVRARFVSLVQAASDLLLGEKTAYSLVATPSFAACDNLMYLADRLSHLNHAPRSIVMNRADLACTSFFSPLHAMSSSGSVSAPILQALRALESERRTRAEAADRFCAELHRRLPGIPQVRLPQIEAAHPEVVVMALSEALDRHIDTLVGHS